MFKSTRFRGNDRLVSAASNAPPLKKGDKGQAVRLLQQALVDLKYPLPDSTSKGYFDGDYGKETKAAVKKFQTDQKLDSKDGIAGEQTLGKLDDLLFGKPWTPLPPPPGGFDPAEEEANARQIFLETLTMPQVSTLQLALSYDTFRWGSIQNHRVHIWGDSWGKVASAVDEGRLDIRIDTSLPEAARYDPAGDVFLLSRPLDPLSPLDKSKIVHEAAHAICDGKGHTMDYIFSELVAFVAEAIFYKKRYGGVKPGGSDSAKKIYEVAAQVADQIAKGPDKDLMDKLYKNIQSDPDYGKNDGNTVAYNGFPL